MLTQLTIRNVALMQQVEVPFGPGLTVLTGETGAGKSMLLDALGLALGARAEAGLIRAGEETADVTALFHPTPSPTLTHFLAESGLEPEPDGTLHLRRQIRKNGEGTTSKAWVNGTPVTLTTLQTLADELVDLHAQHAAHALLNPSTQRQWLDALGGHETERNATREAWRAWQNALHQRHNAEQQAQQAEREGAEARRMEEDFTALAYQPGEEASLEAARQRAKHAEALASAFATADAALNSPEGALNALSMAEKALIQATRIDATLTPLADRLTAARVELADIAYETARVAMPEEGLTLEAIDDRLHAIRSMARRYGCPAEDLPALAQTARERRALLENGADILQALTQKVSEAEHTYHQAAKVLTQARLRAAEAHTPPLHTLLHAMHLPHARLTLAVLPSSPSAEGSDEVQFSLSSNPGNPPQPLQKVASGGELSRVMLAIKCHFAVATPPKTIIFDESDTGLGGAAASSIGEVLQKLGQTHQVLSITHHPQVAAYGHQHLKIHKTTSQSVTTTHLEVLADSGRKEELARMLAGLTLTPAAQAAAESLLAEGQKAA